MMQEGKYDLAYILLAYTFINW